MALLFFQSSTHKTQNPPASFSSGGGCEVLIALA
jgi:hypothetical protein